MLKSVIVDGFLPSRPRNLLEMVDGSLPWMDAFPRISPTLLTCDGDRDADGFCSQSRVEEKYPLLKLSLLMVYLLNSFS